MAKAKGDGNGETATRSYEKKPLPEGMIKRGKVYWAWFRRRGKLVRKPLGKVLKEAKEELAELQTRYKRGHVTATGNDYPWEELKKWFFAEADKTRMGREYRRDIAQFEAYLPIVSVIDITPEFIQGWQQWRSKQRKRGRADAPFVSPRTVNRELATLQAMLNMAAKPPSQKILFNPVVNVGFLEEDTPTKVRRPLTTEEIAALMDNSPEFLRRVWRMFLVTGMRREELIGLKFSEINFNRRQIELPKGNRTKNGEGRNIPLDDAAFEMLVQLRDEAKKRKPVEGKYSEQTERQATNFSRDHVFVTKVNTPLSNNILRHFYACCKRAGIEDAHPGGKVDIHSLRGTAASLAIDSGQSLKGVQTLLGHSTETITLDKYIRTFDRAKQDVVEALARIVEGGPHQRQKKIRPRTQNVHTG